MRGGAPLLRGSVPSLSRQRVKNEVESGFLLMSVGWLMINTFMVPVASNIVSSLSGSIGRGGITAPSAHQASVQVQS